MEAKRMYIQVTLRYLSTCIILCVLDVHNSYQTFGMLIVKLQKISFSLQCTNYKDMKVIVVYYNRKLGNLMLLSS